MVRKIVTVVIAFLLGGVAVMSLEAIGHQIYPIPPEVDATDLDQLAL